MGYLAILLILAAVVCHIIILVDAFKNEVWKGILGLFCVFYLLYYAIVEYQASNKWLIVGIWVAAGLIGNGLTFGSVLSGSHLGAGALGR